MPKVSVVVPIYNVAAFLPQCLDSIICQTLADIEIICINDGSTDNSGDILAKYAIKDNRIKVITQSNQGVSVARNTGVQMASADYIAFVDSDDELAPTFLEKMYNMITQTNADVVWCDFVQGTQPPKWIDRNAQRQVYNDPFDRFVMECPNMQMVIWNKLWRKEIVQKCPFIADLKYGEDVVFLYQTVYLIHQAVHISVPLYFYREREGSVVHSSFNHKIIDDAGITVQALHMYFADKPMKQKTYKILYAKLAKRLFKFCVLEPKRKDKQNMHKWYEYTRPLLKKLKQQGIYQPHYLTLKNRIKSYLFLKGK